MNVMTKSLCHDATSSKKRAYNKDYYQAHKDYWKNYYSKGLTVGRTTRQDPYNGGLDSWSNLVSQTGDSESSSAYNHALYDAPEYHVHQMTNILARKFGNQFASDWNSGAKMIMKAGKNFVDDWKTGFNSFFKKKPVQVTNTWSGTVGGQPVSGSNSFILKNKRR